MKTFEDFLEEYFLDQGEYGGIPIMKDNFETLFDNWSSELDVDELLEFGNKYGKDLIKNYEKR